MLKSVFMHDTLYLKGYANITAILHPKHHHSMLCIFFTCLSLEIIVKRFSVI